MNKIDRFGLVNRHNISIGSFDPLNALSVGNGEFAFTADITGLQTFPEHYEDGVRLGTQSNWGWHSFPNPENYKLEEAVKYFESCEGEVPYLVQHAGGREKAAADWYRQNPHRLHLGLIGLQILNEEGNEIGLGDIQMIDQQLNLWTGKLESKFEVGGIPVTTIVYAHQEKDQLSVKVTSPLISQKRLKIKMDFPYGANCHVCPGYDLDSEDRHETVLGEQDGKNATFSRKLDGTDYVVKMAWEQQADLENVERHRFLLAPGAEVEELAFSCLFSPEETSATPVGFTGTAENNTAQWEAFWQSGGAIDFSGATDPRAKEIERRTVLSQYLTKIQCSGSLPPQETGLTYNSWYGKFHLEMHWWHGTHFPLWNRAGLLEKSLWWYGETLEKAKGTAQWQGYEGARWPKMVGPDGRESPSSVGTLLLWQQPHIIYFAELLYRQDPNGTAIAKYKNLVQETADFMYSVLHYDESEDQYNLCHPIIPAQEVFKPMETDNPIFELSYWHYALSVAQKWREREGLAPNSDWEKAIAKLAPFPEKDGLYLPHANCLDAYTNPGNRKDHPIVLGTFGFLPLSPKLDTTVMQQTLREVWQEWDWPSTWGWDYPMTAMTAARLGEPEMAIEALLKDVPKNTYLINGHNYQDQRLTIYLPGNGGFLTAVAMMAAGWDGSEGDAPGFPKNGEWNVKWENLSPMP